MKKFRASKSAGLKLLLIMAILAIPMVLFGGSALQQARHDINFLDRERLGAQLTQIAMAQHLAGMKTLPASSLVRIKEIEQKLGIEEAENYERHFYKSVADFDEHDHGNETIPGYIGDVASTSGLILDNDETTYHLASALTVSLPSLIGSVDEVITQLKLKDSGPNARFQLAVLLGLIKSELMRAEESIRRSKTSSSQPEAYQKIEESIATIDAATVKYSNHFMVGLSSGDSVVLRQQVRDVKSAAQMMMVPGYALLNDLLDSRQRWKMKYLFTLASVGVLGALIALGLAGSMFSKTLKRLDEVESAQKTSEEMRVEAERVNEEVAVLNVNLSQKLLELKAAQDELLNKGKMEQLGHLTATVAHEIRNPLAAVRTSAFVIARKIRGKNIDIEPQLERINKGIERCDAIITQLLDFSRTKQVQTVAANLDEWLEKTVVEDSEMVPTSVAIECHLGLEKTEVNFDGTRLRRALLNLMTNASEAMVGKDKDAMSAAHSNPKIRISTRLAGDEVCIDVADNGPGMTSDVLARIREPLFTTKNFGTGLGLPAVEQIAIQHGGRLLIESEPGVGSKFSIYLPLDKSAERVAA